MHRTDAVELAEWMGDEWVTRRFESGVGGGTWLLGQKRFPFQPSICLRIIFFLFGLKGICHSWYHTGQGFGSLHRPIEGHAEHMKSLPPNLRLVFLVAE